MRSDAMNSDRPPPRHVWRRTIVVIACLFVVLVVIRLFLPGVVKHEVNVRLSRIPDYTGHVDGVGLHVLHGGYSMQGLVIRKRNAAANEEPFVAIDHIDFSVAYRKLIHGQLVSDIVIDKGQINFLNSPAPQQKQNLGKAPQPSGKAPAPDQRWQDVVHDLFPIDIEHLELHDSRIHFIDTTNHPRIDLAIDGLEVEASGLRNRAVKGANDLPAQIQLHGETIGRGRLTLYIAAEPLATQPHFRLKLSLENVSLPALNDFLLAYGNIDVSKGEMQLYTEISGSGGNFEGYVKPLFSDLNFNTRSDDQKNVMQRLWKDLVAATTRLMRDKDRKQVATLVPFSGRFDQTTDVRIWNTIGNLVRNGFIEALRRGLEGSPATTTPKNG